LVGFTWIFAISLGFLTLLSGYWSRIFDFSHRERKEHKKLAVSHDGTVRHTEKIEDDYENEDEDDFLKNQTLFVLVLACPKTSFEQLVSGCLASARWRRHPTASAR
jgi:hypothetical protein